MRQFGLTIALAASACLSGCAVGPRYQRPLVQSPPTWKTQGPWREAAPKDAFPKGSWWEVFHDEELNGYEQQLLKANQSLAAARDRLDQARSLARVASAGLFPVASTDTNASRNRYSGNRPQIVTSGPALTQSLFEIPFALNYEVDLFGRARKTLQAANASLQATAADLGNVQLVLTAELAADYFSLRELDAEYAVVQESVKIQEEGLALVNHRHEGGIASGLDVAQQQTLLDSTVTQLSLLQQQRAQFEHAMAVLTGNPASAFSVAVAPLHAAPPPVPLGMPSDLLERRPDIATAERTMAQQNALVGVAKTSFYPQLTISGGGGVESTALSSLISAPSAFWSLGGDLLQPIFNGGKNRATLAAQKSAYDESVANYRESVLTAFQQVEDGLSDLNSLSQAAASQNAAVADARRALDIANNRYVGGLTNFLDVITAQSVLLTNERLSTQLLGQQMVASVFLVKALGGGWDASAIQNEQVHPKPVQTVQP
ncbi:MAG TPA: efflux transporter outer membrane subunit [Candidatus Acidoferrales bacterium]|nr:efflux transporter outer membrane subunit [Candidatus Acidoferrales bacterium]